MAVSSIKYKSAALLLILFQKSVLSQVATQTAAHLRTQNDSINSSFNQDESSHSRQLNLDPKTVVYKPLFKTALQDPTNPILTSETHDERYDTNSVIAIINTPKCGTGGMYTHFAESFGCHFRKARVEGVFIAPCENPRGVDIIKAHDHDHGIRYLKDIFLERREGHTRGGRVKKCLVVTAVRDPKTWFPSKFMEDEKRRYCEVPRGEISPEVAVEEYRRWLVQHADRTRHRAQWNIPHFMDMWRTTLTDQMPILERNEGYSLLPPLPTEVIPEGSVADRCTLLFLHFEHAERWPQIFAGVSPEISYEAPENRYELCPENADRYEAIKNYRFSDEEKLNFIGNDEYSPYLREWFQVYGFFPGQDGPIGTVSGSVGVSGGDVAGMPAGSADVIDSVAARNSIMIQHHFTAESKTTFHKNSIIAVINTPKCGTGGLYKHFMDSYHCSFKQTYMDGVQLGPCEKPTSVDVLKSHNHENSLQYLKAYLDERLKIDRFYRRCLIITAVRDPKTWLPSKFMEDEKQKYCTAPKNEITADQAVQNFRKWLKTKAAKTRHRAQWNIPHFLKMYGTSLTEQMKIFESNQGVSFLHPVNPPDESLAPSATMKDLPVQSFCSLLLLQVEHAETWPETMQKVAPGAPYQAPEDRDELCPNNVDRNRAIKDYALTMEEKRDFIGNDQYSDYLAEWFNVYGYMEDTARPTNTAASSSTALEVVSNNNNNAPHVVVTNNPAAPTPIFNQKSIIAIVNTPKCGTGGLAVHFQHVFDCRLYGTSMSGVTMGHCHNEVDIMKSHIHENALAFLGQTLAQKLSEGHPKKCMIITAVRHPRTWFPSKFMEDEKDKYCDATDITPDQAVQDFRTWLKASAKRTRQRAQWNIPHFLKMYGTSLTEQMPILEQNGGYSLLGPVPTSSAAPSSSSFNDISIPRVCSLLFLQLEHSDSWPGVFNVLAPGSSYQAPEDRNELCPNNVERNNAIKSYELTLEEKTAFIGNDEYSDYLAEWFRAYAY